MKRVLLCLLIATLISGCAHVSPWEKRGLARPHMAFEPDKLEARFMKKVHQAKEGTAGGYGVGGGGCGCN